MQSETQFRDVLGYVQLYLDKTGTTLRSVTLVAYFVHRTFSMVLARNQQLLISDGNIVLRFLPVCRSD